MSTGKFAVSAKQALLRSSVWVVVSIFFLDVSWHRITDLRSAGHPVSGWREAQVAFWLCMIVFWAFRAVRDLARWRAERKPA